MDLKDYIRTVPDYPVPGVNFYDLNSLFAGPKFSEAMNQLVTRTKYTFGDSGPTHIVGIESRGFVMGSVLAYAMKLPFVMVRKKGAKGLGDLITTTEARKRGFKPEANEQQVPVAPNDMPQKGYTAEYWNKKGFKN